MGRLSECEMTKIERGYAQIVFSRIDLYRNRCKRFNPRHQFSLLCAPIYSFVFIVLLASSSISTNNPVHQSMFRGCDYSPN